MSSGEWASGQASRIRQELAQDFGRGINRLGDDILGAVIAERVLKLLLQQDAERFRPAILMAEAVLEKTRSIYGLEVRNGD